jgi:Phage integrase, N-terminal SAM-like domain
VTHVVDHRRPLAAVTHGRTATRVAARRAPSPKKHGERPNLRPRTVDRYRSLMKKRVAPYLGDMPTGKLSAAMVREWR